MVLSSYVEGRWVAGAASGAPVFHAVTGEKIAEVSSADLDPVAVLGYARQTGGPALRRLTIHQRAMMLKRLAMYLTERKDELYRASVPSGATKRDCWIDVDGGIGTLFTYASKGRRELPNQPFHIDGPMERISKNNTFAGQHICVPLEGCAVHINAFNFPCWGMLEKLAPTLLAGMPAIIKPASSTSYVAHRLGELIVESGILPAGAFQLLCGSARALLDHLTCQDVVSLTGSRETGLSIKRHPRIVEEAVRFNLEADSLNCTILGPDAAPGSEEFRLFVEEVVREMTVKAGQKCTVIRRIIVPQSTIDPVVSAVKAALAKVVIGDPAVEGVRMGPLVSREQADDVRSNTRRLLEGGEIALGSFDSPPLQGDRCVPDAFLGPVLIHCPRPHQTNAVHSVEAFGPVSTVMPYSDLEDAISLANRGGGSLCASLFTKDDAIARRVCLGIAPFHGRLLLMNEHAAKESTGHGSPLPHLVHGGPGRAGGGEELGGVRSVMHYMQRVALQASPERLTAICGTWMTGADELRDPIHPFRKHFEELRIGETLVTHRRTITEADVVNFAALSGDHFYAHVDEIGAAESIFERRVAHGYLVLAAAAGLFVDPAPGPVLANYGLEGLRFVKPVYLGDTIRVRLTCKEKAPRFGEDRGIVSWDVAVTNQSEELVASYTVLTLVRARSVLEPR